jgi:ribonucleoside-diphosphate reductase alpha chain
MTTRQILPARRESLTQKIRVGNRRTLYLSTQAASPPLELFVRVRGQDCTAETVALYDCLARLASVALQYGAPVETVGKLLRGVKVEPAGLVTGHPTMHFCSSLPDAIGQHLLSLCQETSPTHSGGDQ